MRKSPWRQRLEARLWHWRNHNKSLNRRAAVETYLYDVYRGKEPINRDICRILATHLGVPQEHMTLPQKIEAYKETRGRAR